MRLGVTLQDWQGGSKVGRDQAQTKAEEQCGG